MKMKAFCMLCLMSFFVCQSFSQVSLHPDNAVSQLVEKQQSLSASMTGKSVGYRVQIFFSSGNNSREQAFKVKNEFALQYPKVSAYISFKEPNFRVRVGDFRTRAEAFGFLKEIEAQFPQSFVVKDDIAYVKHEYNNSRE